MNRGTVLSAGNWAVLAIGVGMLLGCQTGYGPFQQTPVRIPPPPTGSVGRADPYYQSNSGVAAQGAQAYSARANTRSRERFTSDQRGVRAREPEPIDTSLDPTLDPALDPTRDRTLDQSRIHTNGYPNDGALPARHGVSFNESLNWRSPYDDDQVMTASGYSRPRPRFRNY